MFIQPVIKLQNLTAIFRGRRAWMGDHESDGLEYQDDEEEEDEDDEPVDDLTGGGALSSAQTPSATAAPRMHNAPHECAIRMPRGKAVNTGARGPITPATGPGQVSTLAEALFATGATFGHKVAKSVCSFCVLQVHSHPGAEDRRHGDSDVDGSSYNLICFHDDLTAQAFNQDAPLT